MRTRPLISDDDWQRQFAALGQFKQAHGHCKVPARWRDQELARWVLQQHREFAQGTLRPSRQIALDGLGFAWRADSARQDDLWERRLQQVVAFMRQHGHGRIPTWSPPSTRTSLATWVLRQRRLRRQGTLDPERTRRLDEIGFLWDSFEDQWLGMRARLASWRERHGHCCVPRHDRKDPKLAVWVGNQRIFRRKGLLSAERIASLDTLGFEWEPRHTCPTDDRVEQLREFRREHGHLAVPVRGNSGLVQWMAHKRLLHSRAQLDAKLERKLDAMGFPWTWEEQEWELWFARAIDLGRRTGRFEPKGGTTLDRWMCSQRQAASSGDLEEDRYHRLGSIGFWKRWRP
ncbi:MAG: helicase associated domain-containing protein [Deltaproteobacteria bacterium]|nr:helicase associated domain-containing protein [Deltaproteobacteria bacterium]